jgi:general stress protein YciG
MAWELVTPAKRGFAAMTPERRREIASKGGKSVPASNRSYSKDKALASKSGMKGGRSVDPAKRMFKKDPTLASRAGKASVEVRRKK